MRLNTRSALLSALILALCVHSAAAGVRAVDDGKPAATIFLRDAGDKLESTAAEELQSHVELITGVKLPITRVAPGAPVPAADKQSTTILLGEVASSEENTKAIGAVSADPSAFLLRVEKGRVEVVGNSPAGTLIGVYEALEQLGVRWYMPGEIGRVVPSSKSVEWNEQATIQGPSFAARWAAPADPVWQRRMRMGGRYFSGAHGILPFRGSNAERAAQLEKFPEVFALDAKNGKRRASQLCLTNPKTLEMTIAATKEFFRANPKTDAIGMGANDGRGFCECEKCKALDSGDWDPFANEPSMTDRYIWFFNQVLKGIESEFPDKHIETYIYHSYIRPPVNIQPDPRIRGALAPIALCRIHGPGNPVCPEAGYYSWLAAGWSTKIKEVYDRGYWFNLADPGFPFIMIHRIRAQVPLAKTAGIVGWRVETMPHWGSETPSLYVASKLMWDHRADVDAILDDFHKKFYGPARGPMQAYTTLLDHAMRDADHHTGSSFDLPLIYSRKLRTQARGLLDEAAKLALHPPFATRVAIARASFDAMDAFVEMLEARDRLDFPAAGQSLRLLDTMQEKLIKGFEFPMISARSAPAYLKRFFRLPIEQGLARVTEGNRVVAALNDEWEFQIDPQTIGETLGWQSPGLAGGNWQKILASSSWSNQGLRYYKGEAWYRQSVEVPAEFEGKRVFLWFAGVDEKAKVFVNGKAIGINSGSAFTPFELDATEAVLAGKPNLVAVRVVNSRVDELGTGGVIGPSVFYAPKAGRDATLNNVRPLGDTFP